MRVLIKRLHPDAVIPRYAHGPLEDAGLDLCSVAEAMLIPNVAQAVPTGLSIQLPSGYECQVRPRSGDDQSARVGVLLATDGGE